MKSPENTTKKLLVAVFLLFLFPLIAFAGFSPLGEIDMETAKKMIDDLNSRDPIVGVYEMAKGSYRGDFLVIPNTVKSRPEAAYLALVAKSKNQYEKNGFVKFWLRPTESPNVYKVEYYDFHFSGTAKGNATCYVTPGMLSIHIGPARFAPNTFVRIYPVK